MEAPTPTPTPPTDFKHKQHTALKIQQGGAADFDLWFSSMQKAKPSSVYKVGADLVAGALYLVARAVLTKAPLTFSRCTHQDAAWTIFTFVFH